MIGEINHRTAHLMNILWLVGTFTFAIVLGVVTEDIVNHVVVSPATHVSVPHGKAKDCFFSLLARFTCCVSATFASYLHLLPMEFQQLSFRTQMHRA